METGVQIQEIEDEQNQRKSDWGKDGSRHAYRERLVWKRCTLSAYGLADSLGRENQGRLFAMSFAPNVVSSRGRFGERVVTCSLFSSVWKVAWEAEKTYPVENL
tara:strand:- start:311 stop:622 length:312 start_codon:yes stop_codon:yes gene_type:complete